MLHKLITGQTFQIGDKIFIDPGTGLGAKSGEFVGITRDVKDFKSPGLFVVFYEPVMEKTTTITGTLTETKLSMDISVKSELKIT